MEARQVLHMNGGAGETSYANNSSLQRSVILMTKPIMEEAIASLYLEMSPQPSTLAIADLGCSSGPNAFFTVSVLVGAVPKGLDCNKGNIYIGNTSPKTVIDAYYGQFQNDFSAFLNHRGLELVPGGRMVLTMLGRRGEDPSSRKSCCLLELLALALNEMVSEGLIEEEKMDAFNVPVYQPSPSEVKAEVLKEGSFSINCLEVSEIHWTGKIKSDNDDDNSSRWKNHQEEGYIVARTMRAVTEPPVISHFGVGIVEDVFRRYRLLIQDRMAKEKTEYTNITISLTRRTPA